MEVPIFSKSDCIRHYTWGDDCHAWVLIDNDFISVKQELMPPDTVEQLHYHEDTTQVFYILKGRAIFIIDGAEHQLREQQGIEIKPFQKHYISNKGDIDLEFTVYSYPNEDYDRIDVE